MECEREEEPTRHGRDVASLSSDRKAGSEAGFEGRGKSRFCCGHLEFPPECQESLINFILTPHSVTISTLLKTEWTAEETHGLGNPEDSISGP